MSSQVAEVSAKYLAEAAKNAVPTGYKQTEVGVIPEDWEVLSIDDTSIKVGSGKTPTGGSTVYVDCGRPFIRSQNVGWGKLELSDVAFITDEIHQTFTGSEIQEHDVLLNITGASIGRCAKADERIAAGNVNQHVCIVRTDCKKLLPKLLVELINSSIGQNQIDSYQAGGNREGLNFSQVRQLRFAISKNKQEQTAIANALTDVDALISELEKLIAKKQAIKTATMQQLLTGRTRLPQFALREDGTPKGTKPSELGEIPEDWEIQCLGDFIAALDAGVSVNSVDKTDAFPHGKHILKTSCVDRGNFIAGEKKSILPSDLLRAKCSPTKGAIIVSRMNTPALVGEIGYVTSDHPDLFLPDRLWQMRFKEGSSVNARWLSYVLSFPSNAKRIKDAATGTSGSMKNIAKSGLMGLEIAFPIYDEQTAIATILSDMDAELQALEQRLGKTRQIKQGMMQELLTGKTRLIKGEAHG